MINLTMKKLAALASGITYLATVVSVFAEETIQISPPILQGKRVGYTSLADFINKVIILAFIIAVIAVLVMLIWGAIQWIFSGGEKEAVAGARNRILHALIGLAILAVAFALARVAGQFLGFDIFGTFTIPSPSQT